MMSTRNSPCSCGSGKRFKHCCGALPATLAAGQGATPYTRYGYFQEQHRGRGMLPFVDDMPPGIGALEWVPPGVMVLDDYLDAATCERWTDYFSRKDSAPVKIQKIDELKPGGQPQFELDERRVTERVQTGSLGDELKQVLYGAYRDVIFPNFDKRMGWMDRPDVLKYVTGGKYIVHADNAYWDMGARRWVRSINRDISVLLYINGAYEGGALYFQNFAVRITPSPGTLIAFPSDHRYLHAVEPVTSGLRFAVTCWSSIEGRSKVQPVVP